MLSSTRTNVNANVNDKRGYEAYEQRQLRLLTKQTGENEFLSTRINANDFHKHKIRDKLCCKTQEQRQLRLLSTRTRANEVPKHKNKCK